MIPFSKKLSCWKLLNAKSYQMNDKSSCFKPKSCTPSPPQKIHPTTIVIFPELGLSSSNNNNKNYFLKRKLFLYFRKWNPALFNSSPKNKKVHREKIPYNSENGTFRTQKVKKSPLLKCFLHIRH